MDDVARPLKDRGKRDAQRIGAWLYREDLQPDLVLCSPAARAHETAEKACKAMGIATSAIVTSARLYGADVAAHLRVLGRIPPIARRVMLVGHNPGLEELLCFLVTPLLRSEGKLLPTAALARVALPCEFAAIGAGAGKLLALQLPSELPRRFPFPAPDGRETRRRPAYYYSQSAVIPYRRHARHPERIEVLIIRTSKLRHYTVPKGIHEPGLSAEESAAKEALEEAGILGRVLPDAIGTYEHVKWGAPCVVKVYAMEVTRELDHSRWLESHRTRRWVSPERAARRVEQDGLSRLITRLASRLAR